MYLQLEDLTKVFSARERSGEVVAVDRVNLTIEQGEFVTLLGPSGCGKTTTLRLIAGFEFPTAGRLVLDGQEINTLPPNRRDMAMVFQSYAIFPHLNVFENIAYGLNVRKLPAADIRRSVAEAMALTELTGLENRAPNQLSGGQQQRVALARALVMKPKVLLFDEPLSNLDAKLRVQMRGEIRRIQQELGITSVYVTHDQDEAMVLSDRIVVMHMGRVQQSGAPVTVYRAPANRFVADFIGRANFLPVTLRAKQGDTWQVQAGDATLHAAAAPFDLDTGAQATLLVRPESVRISSTPLPGAQVLPGAVRRTLYLGAQAEYEVEALGSVLIAVRHDPRPEDLLPPGSPIYLEFLSDNLYLLPEN